MNRFASLSTALLLSTFAARAAAAPFGGEFRDGDLYVVTTSLPTPLFSGAGVIRIDPATGSVNQVLAAQWTSLGGISFDSYRGKLILSAQPNSGPTMTSFIQLDADGTVTPLAGIPLGSSYTAPTGDGRIYYMFNNGTGLLQVRYIDAANVSHNVLDAGGVNNLTFNSSSVLAVRDLYYSAPTNELWIATALNGSACGWVGGSVGSVSVIPLNAAGTQATALTQTYPLCLPVPNPGPSSGYVTNKFSTGPNGKVMAGFNYNGTTNVPIAALIDPVTKLATPYASNSNIEVCNSAAFSTVLNAATTLDTFNDEIHVRGQFVTGVLGVGKVSSAGGFNETCSLIEVRVHESGLLPYGTGTPGCAGPQGLTGNQTPKAGAADFRLNCTNAPASSLGLLLVGDAQNPAGADVLGLGILLHIDLLTTSFLDSLDIVSNSLGTSTTPGPIPLSASLIGQTFDTQAIWAWPSCATPPSVYGLSSSNGLAITIQ